MATMPRLDVPSTMNKPGPWVVQPINPLSDGDPSKWKPPPYRAISNDAYRVKIGAMWAEHKGLGTAGKWLCISLHSFMLCLRLTTLTVYHEAYELL